MKIFCIHGNFQTVKVWQPLEERMKAGFTDLEMITEDLYAKQFQSFDDWTEDFCGRVDAQANGEKSILLGYSLGGRLALHACLSRPDLWKSAIVVGADPGLESEEEYWREDYQPKAENEPKIIVNYTIIPSQPKVVKHSEKKEEEE